MRMSFDCGVLHSTLQVTFPTSIQMTNVHAQQVYLSTDTRWTRWLCTSWKRTRWECSIKEYDWNGLLAAIAFSPGILVDFIPNRKFRQSSDTSVPGSKFTLQFYSVYVSHKMRWRKGSNSSWVCNMLTTDWPDITSIQRGQIRNNPPCTCGLSKCSSNSQPCISISKVKKTRPVSSRDMTLTCTASSLGCWSS